MDQVQKDQQKEPQVSVPMGGAESASVVVSSAEQPGNSTEVEKFTENGPEFAEKPEIHEELAQVGIKSHSEPKVPVVPGVTPSIPDKITGPYNISFSSPEDAKNTFKKGSEKDAKTWSAVEWLKNFFGAKQPSEA